MHTDTYVIGLDFGTDSVRALLVNAADGNEISTAVSHYRRWKEGRYCDPAANMFRQHPLDYLESMSEAVKGTLEGISQEVLSRIKGISIDTTGSTPVAVDKSGSPLGMLDDFADNPNAQFVLWKDHTAVAEADEINHTARTWGGTDFSCYSGGIYSSEWFWSKILHLLRHDKAIRDAAFSWVEHCDWIAGELCGNTDPLKMKRSRCAAGHKAMWHASFDGLPSDKFLRNVDPLLGGLRSRLFTDTHTVETAAGTLTGKWAEKLGLPHDIIVGVGAFDAHMGAVGGGIRKYILTKIIGTSTCDVLVAPMNEMGDKLVKGICGQVDGSVIPGMLGMEAGQSAYGDVYAWFKDLLLWPSRTFAQSGSADSFEERIIPELSEQAERVSMSKSAIIASDWLNGRRTPDADQNLKGAITGLNLGSSAPAIFRALVEATAFGSKMIVDRFEEEGVPINGVIALGGVPKKSPFVMQTLADILNRDIQVVSSEQACALGAAMCAATACGIYPDLETAIDKMNSDYEKTYKPNLENTAAYERLYEKYRHLGTFIEQETERA